MKAAPSTGEKTLLGGMFMNTAKDHNHEKKKNHQLTVKLEVAERGNASTPVGFLRAQQMSPTDDICGAFTRQICAGLCQ